MTRIAILGVAAYVAMSIRMTVFKIKLQKVKEAEKSKETSTVNEPAKPIDSPKSKPKKMKKSAINDDDDDDDDEKHSRAKMFVLILFLLFDYFLPFPFLCQSIHPPPPCILSFHSLFFFLFSLAFLPLFSHFP